MNHNDAVGEARAIRANIINDVQWTECIKIQVIMLSVGKFFSLIYELR